MESAWGDKLIVTVPYVSGDRCDEPKLSNDHERSAGPWDHSFGVSVDTVRPKVPNNVDRS